MVKPCGVTVTVSERVRAIVAALPIGGTVTLPVAALREWLVEDDTLAPRPAVVVTEPTSWRERLWVCPADTRLGVTEVAEACDRSPDWVYRAVNAKQARAKGRNPLPCSRIDGALQFTAGAVRDWLKASEHTVNPIQSMRPTR